MSSSIAAKLKDPKLTQAIQQWVAKHAAANEQSHEKQQIPQQQHQRFHSQRTLSDSHSRKPHVGNYRMLMANTKFVTCPTSLRRMFDDFQKQFDDSTPSIYTPDFLRACALAAIRLRSPEHARFYIGELDEWEKSHRGSEKPDFRRSFLYSTLTWASFRDLEFCQDLFRKIPEANLQTRDVMKMVFYLRKEPRVATEYVRLMIFHNLRPDPKGMLRALWLLSLFGLACTQFR